MNGASTNMHANIDRVYCVYVYGVLCAPVQPLSSARRHNEHYTVYPTPSQTLAIHLSLSLYIIKPCTTLRLSRMAEVSIESISIYGKPPPPQARQQIRIHETYSSNDLDICV